jgi:hypothetical protein
MFKINILREIEEHNIHLKELSLVHQGRQIIARTVLLALPLLFEK